MPSWKKVIVSGSDARFATLFTSGHVTASANISGSGLATASFGKILGDGSEITNVPTNVTVEQASDPTHNTQHYITFVPNNNGGIQNTQTFASLKYLPSTDTIWSKVIAAVRPRVKYTNNSDAINILGSSETRFSVNTYDSSSNFEAADNNSPITMKPGIGSIQATLFEGPATKPKYSFTNDSDTFNIMIAGTSTNASGQSDEASSFKSSHSGKPVTVQPSTGTVGAISFKGEGIQLRDSTISSTYYTTLNAGNIGGSRIISLPDQSGTVMLTSDAAGTVTLAAENTNADRFIPFGEGEGDYALKIDAGLKYNPNDNELLANASTATALQTPRKIGGVNFDGTSDILGLIVSSSAQIADDISGSFTEPSSSFSSRVTTLETNISTQPLNTTDSPRFAGMNVDGDLTARRLIISSSVSIITSSFSSGSTLFGDDILDTHRFSGSVSISGSIVSNGLPVVSSSAQIADAISGSFGIVSQSIADSRTLQSQSFQNRISQVESGVGDGGSFSGTNTGDITLGGLYNYLSLTNQVLSLGQVELNTDITGSLGAIHLKGSTAASAISGAFTATSSSIASRVDNLVVVSGSLGDRITTLKTDTTAHSSSLSGRISSVEVSAGGQDLATTASPTFQNLTLTGSLKISSSRSSTAIEASNIQNGYPTSNDWGTNLEGSYFNNFTNETHVSEILRFIAGAMSHSLNVADAAPNSKFLNSISTTYSGTTTTTKNSLFTGVLGSSHETAKLSQHWTSSAAIDMSETGSYRLVQDYLISKGFMVSGDRGSFANDTGTNPFNDSYGANIPSTVSTNGDFDNFTFSVSSVAGGSTNFNSSADAQLFGLGSLNSGNANAYQVKIIASQSFSDTQTDTTPDASSTFHKKETTTYTQNSFGTSNGLTLAKINTSQPAVIPAAYQDGKFSSVASPFTGRFYTGGSQDQNSISASGYYKFHDIRVGIKSGSQSDFVYKNGSDSNTLFYLYAGGLPADITTSVPTSVISNPNLVRTSFTATSMSISGAPYLKTATYAHTFSSEASKSFDPAYKPLNALQHDISTDNFNTIGTTSLGSHTTVNIDANGVNTSTADVKGVLSADKSTLRADGDVPHIDDVTFLSSSFTFTLDSSFNNTVQTKTAQAAIQYTNTFRVRARNWKNDTQNNTDTTVNFYDATLFGHNSSSGSLAIYSYNQSYDAGSLTGTTEQFSGEDYRIQVNNNVVSFGGQAWTTTFNNYNALQTLDLQVKPGFLVDPGGSYGYWFPTGFRASTYKYYIRKFQTSGTKTSMTLNVGTALQAWNSSNNGVSAVILFKSSADTEFARARIYDPTATSDNDIETNISNDNHKNPFSDAIDLYGNTGGSLSSTTYTIPLRNIDGMTLDNTNNQYYLIIRYKGDPTPITQITVSYS